MTKAPSNYRYRVFGGVLESELEMPDLPLSANGESAPDWSLRIRSGAAHVPISDPAGRHQVAPGRVLTLWTIESGFYLHYGPVGSYEIEVPTGRVEWFPVPGCDLEVARSLFLGQIMALMLRASGAFCLHGSAVAIRDRGLVLLAPKLFGKSTLALALTTVGAELVTDDLAVIDVSSFRLRPGVQSVRLFADSAGRLAGAHAGAAIPDGKGMVSVPRESLRLDGVPLAAVYVLEPVAPEAAESACERERLSLMEAAVSLAHGTKTPDELLGFRQAADDLSLAIAVAGAVPTYCLRVAFDFGRLDEIAREIAGWETEGSIPLVHASGGRTATCS